MDRYLVISSDTHAGPPTERYRDYLDPKYLEAFDADVAANQQLIGARRDLVDSGDFEENWEHETGDGGKKASWDSTARNIELDREGIVAEVIFPDADVLGGGASAPFGAGLGSSGDLDGELVMAGARAHNRWLAELCSESPERRCGIATVPILHDIEEALTEIRRIANDGFRAMMIPTLWGSQPAYNDPRYEPIWAACADLGIVVHVHSGGASRDIISPPGLVAIYATEAWWWAARPLWALLWSGAFDRNPTLKFALTEDGAWWLPGIVKRMDEKWVGGHNTAKLGNAFRQHVSPPAQRVLRLQHLRRRIDAQPGRDRAPPRDRCWRRFCGGTIFRIPRGPGRILERASMTPSSTSPKARHAGCSAAMLLPSTVSMSLRCPRWRRRSAPPSRMCTRRK